MCKSQNPFYMTRQKAGLSINDFAALLGIGSTTALLLEKGAISNHKITVQKLAVLLGQEPKDIFNSYQDWRQALMAEAREKLKKAR